MIKVLIADDHEIVRRGLRQILDETSDIVVAGEACHGQDVLDEVGKNDYDVILLDIAMPGRSGLDVMKQMRNERVNVPVLFLSIYPEEQYAVRVLKAGASGYLTKESASDELITAIRKVSMGKKYVSSAVMDRIIDHLDIDLDKPPHENLSDREYQVMCMIACGKKLKEISKELALSVKTVSTYRARILEKMGMKSNAEIIHYTIENGLL